MCPLLRTVCDCDCEQFVLTFAHPEACQFSPALAMSRNADDEVELHPNDAARPAIQFGDVLRLLEAARPPPAFQPLPQDDIPLPVLPPPQAPQAPVQAEAEAEVEPDIQARRPRRGQVCANTRLMTFATYFACQNFNTLHTADDIVANCCFTHKILEHC